MLGGISPIDPGFMQNMQRQCVLSHVDVVAVHGFPLDWNHWTIHEWPEKLDEIRAVTDLPLWVSEVGVSTFGAEEVQEFGLRRTAELLSGRSSAFTGTACTTCRAPGRPPPATARRRARPITGTSNGPAARRRHAQAGAARLFASYTPGLGICQWFHFEDHRLDDAVRWLRDWASATCAPA